MSHWAFSWVPLVGALVWLVYLLTLFIDWAIRGKPRFETQRTDFPFLSDLSLGVSKPTFITISCLVGVCYVVSAVLSKHLRRQKKLPPNVHRKDSIASWVAILTSIVSALGLGLFGFFDARASRRNNNIAFAVFMAGAWLSSVSTGFELQWLSKDYKKSPSVQRSYIVQSVVSLLFIITCGVYAFLREISNVKAAFQWVVAFMFAILLFSQFYILAQAKGEKEYRSVEEHLVSDSATDSAYLLSQRSEESGASGNSGRQEGNGHKVIFPDPYDDTYNGR